MSVFDASPEARADRIPVKVVVAGGFGAGKTTMVGSVSEITPLSTEALMTEASRPVDDLTGIAGKATTTVAMDFGRLTLEDPPEVVLHLFGVPGQARFWFTWPDLSHGAVGAVVLADTRRLADSFEAVNFFENRRVPFVVAVNAFDGAHPYGLDEVRAALEVGEPVPVLRCDARDRRSAVAVLIALLDHAIATARPQPLATNPGDLL